MYLHVCMSQKERRQDKTRGGEKRRKRAEKRKKEKKERKRRKRKKILKIRVLCVKM